MQIRRENVGDLIGIKGEVKEMGLIKTYYMCLWNSHTRIKKTMKLYRYALIELQAILSGKIVKQKIK